MKKSIVIIFVICFYACDVMKDVAGEVESIRFEGHPLTEREVAEGLKEALNVGITNAVNIVSVKNGFYKNPEIFIPFPQEAIKIKEVCERTGMSEQVKQFEEKLNNAAELASKNAKDVFVDAIRQMTINDAMSILKGRDNEATEYLKRTSSDKLYSKFYPVVKNATDQIMLAQYWTPLVDKYNKVSILTGAEKVDADLNNYVTEKAIQGLFIMVAKEETNIRKNPVARINDILKRVFGSPLNPHN